MTEADLNLRGLMRLVRIALAAVLLLARAALGFPLAVQPSSATIHDVSAMHVEAGHSVPVMIRTAHPALRDGQHVSGHPMPDCCDSGLCQAPVGVLPTLTSVAWPTASPAVFAPRVVTPASGIRGMPAVPPPRI